VWEIVSIGMAHPFHVHGASFRILSLEGAPPPAHLAGWKDVVLVEDKPSFWLPSPSRDAGASLHVSLSHLEHEDAGMMGQYTCT